MYYTTYILYSSTLDKYYVGYTEDAMVERLRKHNTNHKGFTGGQGDWKVVYIESFIKKTKATDRERQIKAWKSREMIEELCKNYQYRLLK